MANLTFGGPDLRTVYIGSLPGMTIPYFRSVVADQPMIHWQRDIWRKRGASELLHSRSFLSEGAFQVAYVVPDIQATQRFFNKTLGGPRFFVIENITFKEYTYRGQPVECHQHVAFGYAGTMQIELMQPLSGENTASEFLRQRGQGIHHVGIQAADLDSALRGMAE